MKVSHQMRNLSSGYIMQRFCALILLSFLSCMLRSNSEMDCKFSTLNISSSISIFFWFSCYFNSSFCYFYLKQALSLSELSPEPFTVRFKKKLLIMFNLEECFRCESAFISSYFLIDWPNYSVSGPLKALASEPLSLSSTKPLPFSMLFIIKLLFLILLTAWKFFPRIFKKPP
jgi:hypothetical protein